MGPQETLATAQSLFKSRGLHKLEQGFGGGGVIMVKTIQGPELNPKPLNPLGADLPEPTKLRPPARDGQHVGGVAVRSLWGLGFGVWGLGFRV